MSSPILSINQTQEVSELLNHGKVGVMPTDTIYGLHCLAKNLESVERIYDLKNRPENMPLITVISSVSDLSDFDVVVDEFVLSQIDKLWPGPNSLIFDTTVGTTKSFRLPDNEFLQKILANTGPLISTSTNPHGLPAAKSVEDAIKYFDAEVDFYVDAGPLDNPPSNVFKLENKKLIKLR